MVLDNFSYYETSDGTKIRYGFWASNNLCLQNGYPKTVVLFQGRASFIEKFDVIIEGLLRRGFNVWAFDWRGQGLSSRMLDERHKGHIDTYETYLKDAHELLQEKILPNIYGPLIVLGQSMGSHLALRYMSDYPGVFDMAILTAPLLDLNTGGYSKNLARIISQVACRLGLGQAFVMGHDIYDPTREPFEGNMLTHNRAAFFHHRLMQKNNPELSVGGVTYQWVDATFQSIDVLMNAEKMSKITAPVMVISAGEEVVVDNSRAAQAAAWLPSGIYKVYPHARHQILSEIPEIMQQFWRDFEGFIAQHLNYLRRRDLPESRLVETPQFAGMNRAYPALTNNLKSLNPNF